MLRSLTILAYLALSATHADAEAPFFFRVEVSGCADAALNGSHGTAFLARGFRTTHGPAVIITALHVIYKCSHINIIPLKCHAPDRASAIDKSKAWLVPANQVIQMWPHLDLAVIPISDVTVLGPIPATILEIDSSVDTLNRLKAQDIARDIVAVQLNGNSKNSICEHDEMKSQAIVTSKTHYEYIAQRLTGDANAMLGSLSATAWLLEYSGPATNGDSGAPITSLGKIIAVHEAGYNNGDTSWAILLTGTEIKASETEPIAAHSVSWPDGYIPSFLKQSSMSEDDLVDEWGNRSRIPSQNLWGFQVGGVGKIPDIGNSDGIIGQASYSIHPWELSHYRASYLKLGYLAVAAYRHGHVWRRFDAPTGGVLEVRRYYLGEAFGRLGLDLRFDRLHAVFSGSLAAGGLLGSWIHDAEVNPNDGVTRVAWGGWVALSFRLYPTCRVVLGKARCLPIVVTFDTTYQHTPNLEYTYTGIGANYTRGQDSFALYATALLGIEL